MQPVSELLQPNTPITIRALRADRSCYRRWSAQVETISDTCLVTFSPPGTKVEGLNGGWVQQYAIRAFYWTDQPDNLLEVYHADSSLEEIYVHIASPVTLHDTTRHYTDYELDVVMRLGEPPRIVDEDEFMEASARYRYSSEFQTTCYAAAHEALELARTWVVHGWQPSS